MRVLSTRTTTYEVAKYKNNGERGEGEAALFAKATEAKKKT